MKKVIKGTNLETMGTDTLLLDPVIIPESYDVPTTAAVHKCVSKQSSNFAPDYAKQVYTKNSYVMHDGILYTNPNAIETAEDWNPAHWTQTTVAEMFACMDKIPNMTLRFMFSDSSYNPQEAGVGTSGTWKKKLDTNYNVWDWTNNNADWSYAFQDAFKDAGNDVSIIEAGNTSAFTNMLRLFSGCTSLKSVCLFDTSSVTSMVSAFNGASGIENVPLFNTENVSAMNSMFANCSSLVKIPQLNTSKATSFTSFAQQCTSLKEVPLLDTSKASNVGNMFFGCVNVESGAFDLYTQMSGQTNPPSSYAGCFTNCGRDTVTGAAELAQIPSSWGGTGE